MSHVTRKLRKTAIAKNDPLISILRCFSFEGEEKLSHAKWFENHKCGVWGAGRVLQFLTVAEPDKQSVIGWKTRPRFFQIAKKVGSSKCGPTEPPMAQDDAILLDMLYEIAAGVVFDNDLQTSDYFDRTTYCDLQESVADFTSVVFEELGLTVQGDDFNEKPTALLRELFTQGALQIGAPCSSSLFKNVVVGSVDNSDCSPKSRARHSK